MKRPSLLAAIRWIADNDDAATTDVEVIRTYVSTVMVADLFGVDVDHVARNVATVRGYTPQKQRPKG